MSGLITTRPLSMAAAICPADQSAHRSSPVMTSSRTQESTRVAGLIATGLVGTEQRHDLIRAQASHLCAASRIAQPPDQTLAPALRCLIAHNLEHTTDLDYLDLIPGMQPVLGSQVRGDGDLALTVQHHDTLQVVTGVTT